MSYLYAFSANEIQKFILGTDRLRDMVGGSNLIYTLCGELLETSLTELFDKSDRYRILVRAAGWARILFDEKDDAEKMFRWWPLVVSSTVPGVKLAQSLVEITNGLPHAIARTETILREERQVIRAGIPEINPLVMRSPLTGHAAVKPYREPDNTVSHVDATTWKKRTYSSQQTSDTLLVKFTGNPEIDENLFSKEMDQIAGSDEYLAIIHADGNALGRCVMQIESHLELQNISNTDHIIDLYSAFSRAIEETCLSATKAAYEKVLLKDFKKQDDGKTGIIGARPIVLGGDDLTVIVRADLAFEFLRVFLESFESGSRNIIAEQLGPFGMKGFPETFTACAGMAITKRSYPFARSYELAESLCDYAKKIAKQDLSDGDVVPTCFSYYRLTASISGDFSELCEKELQKSSGIKMWLSPYGLGAHAKKLPSFVDLSKLAGLLGSIPSGPVRKLVSDLYLDETIAKKRWNRIMQLLGEANKANIAESLNKTLATLTGTDGQLVSDSGNSPLLEALWLSKYH